MIAFTICTNSYLAQASSLADSFLKHHSDANFIIVLADEPSLEFDYSIINPANLLLIGDISTIDINMLAAKFNIIEFCTALKPSVCKFLMDRNQAEKHILYLDPDLYFYSALNIVTERLNGTTAIVLTPHILSPISPDDKHPTENLFLNYGIYNLGFIALNTFHPTTIQFLDWWEDRVQRNGYDDVANGCFTDQLLVNHVPIFFNDVHVEKSPTLNMAPWNLHERQLRIGEIENPRLQNGEHLVFYHYSRYSFSETDDNIAFYNRFPLQERMDILPLYQQYKHHLVSRGYYSLKNIPSAFGLPLSGQISLTEKSTECLVLRALKKMARIYKRVLYS